MEKIMIFQDQDINELNKFVRLLTEVESNKSPERKGGYLSIIKGVRWLADENRTKPMNIANLEIYPIGKMPSDQKNRYFRLSQEKAHRLYANWLVDPTSCSSWQTRNPNNDLWGGAVLFNDTQDT